MLRWHNKRVEWDEQLEAGVRCMHNVMICAPAQQPPTDFCGFYLTTYTGDGVVATQIEAEMLSNGEGWQLAGPDDGGGAG